MDKVFRERLKNSLQEKPPPAPWELVIFHTIHGIWDVGFGTDSDYLLVLSQYGREVFNCMNGKLMAAEEAEDNFDFFDDVHLFCRGIGSLEGQNVRVGGIHGGGLTLQTADEWQLCIYTWYPESIVVLHDRPPDGPHDLHNATKIFDKQEMVVVCGFSETGKSFVIVMPSTVAIYKRA